MRRNGVVLLVATAVLTVIGCTDSATQPKREVFKAAPGQVNIYRDVWGMPHIYAEREEDGYWGLGYAEAEDRLHGLLYNYLMMKGEVAAHFGPGPSDLGGLAPQPWTVFHSQHGIATWGGPANDLVEQDIEALRWRYLTSARENFSSLSAQTRANVTAYIAGIQRYLDEHPEKVPDWAPTLEPALPLAFANFTMGSSGNDVCQGLLGRTMHASLSLEETASGLQASNAFALAPGRTAEGAVMVASDAHHLFTVGASTHILGARINAGTLDALYVSAPGLPVALIGHSRYFGWGVTEGARFPSDCIAVTTDTDDPRTYLVDGVRNTMYTEPYAIEVKGGETIRGIFEYTHHNGVLSPVVHRDGTTAYVVSSTYMGRAGHAVEQYRKMVAAKNSDELATAMSPPDIYPANLVIGGADGSIHYMRPGRTPIRPDGVDGTSIVDGSTSRTAWSGVRGFDELLHVVNPKQGYLANSNVSPDMMFAEPTIDPNDYPPDFGFEPGHTGSRQLRAIAMLGGDREISFDEANAIVTDVHAEGFDRWNAVFSSIRAAHSRDAGFGEPAFNEFCDALTAFDGDFVPGSRTALVHYLTRDALREADAETAFAIESAVLKGQPLSPEQETTLFAAVRAAFDRLQRRSDATTATFGDVYRVGRGETREPSRGAALLLGMGMITFFPTGYGPDGDSGNSVAGGGSRFPLLVQFTDPIRSVSAAAYGASDDPASPHYSDQSALRGGGTLRSNYFNPDELAAAIESLRTMDTGIPVDDR